MRGRTVDILLFVVWGALFLTMAIVHPGIANLLIALLGAFAMGAYNTFVRHDPVTDQLREPWRTSPVARVDHR
jgi:hypothetical protein